MDLRTLADVPKGNLLRVAFLYCDLSGHSPLVTRYQDGFKPVREAFRAFAKEKADRFGGVQFGWEGDGGTFVFWEGGDSVRRAVLAAMSILSEMYVFNLQHNPFPEFVDVKIGVHGAVVTPTEDPGSWYSEEVNFGGKFSKEAAGIRTGTVALTAPAFASLDVRMRQPFSRTREFQGVAVHEFRREFLDPNVQLFIGWISSKRIIDIQNAEGDAVIEHEITIVNPHPTRDLDAFSTYIGSQDSTMEWRDCGVKARDRASGQALTIEPSDVDDPHIKCWRIRFPALRPGSTPLDLAYSARWNRMFPRQNDWWDSKCPSPLEVLEVRVVFPPGKRPVEGSVRASRHVVPAEVDYLSETCYVKKTESGRWEASLTVSKPRIYHVYRLEWKLQDAS